MNIKTRTSGFVGIALLTVTAMALIAGVSAWEIKRVTKQENQTKKLIAQNMSAEQIPAISFTDAKPTVLADTAEKYTRYFEMNIPSVFNGDVQTNKTNIGGALTLGGDVTGKGVNVDLGSGKITAGNVVYSLQGKSGAVKLEAGAGISIDGLKISAQNASGSISGSGSLNQVAYWSGTSTLAGENNLSVSRGGTGAGTLTGLVLGNGTSAFTTITDNSVNWTAGYTYRITSASGTSPLTLTLSSNGLTGSISDASADGSTKGISTFTASDFNAVSGLIALDYTNGQSASGVAKGFLTSANWTTFNDKESAVSAGTSGQYYRGDKTWQTLNQSAVAGLTTSDSPTFAGATLTGLLGIKNGTYKTTFANSGSQTVDVAYVLPTAAGSAGEVLKTDISGNLYWATVAGGSGGIGTVTSVASGNGLTGGPVTTSGTLSVAVLNSETASTATTSSYSGLEFVGASNQLSLLHGCGASETLSWNNTAKTWQCASVSGIGGVTGSGVAGQVAYWSSGSGLTGSTGFTFSSGVLALASASAPTADMIAISNSGYGTVTNGVDGLSIDFTSTADAGADTNSGINIVFTPSGEAGDTGRGINIATSGISAGTLYGINIAGITGGAGTETALVIGSGWDKSIDASGLISTTSGIITPKIYPSADSTTAIQINKADGTTNVLNVDTTNARVGIGTASPATALDVNGNVTIANGGYIYSSGASPASLKLASGATYPGATLNAQYALTISTQNAANSLSNMIFHLGTGTGAGDLGAWKWISGWQNDVRMLLTPAGQLGIGTTAPQSLLDVQGPVGTGAVGAGILTLATKELTIIDGDELGRINFNSPLATPGSDAILAGASIWAEADDTFSITNNSTELVFGTATTSAAIERMRIDSAGNVGIGTTSPTAQLHILNSVAARIGFIVQGASSQSVDLTQWNPDAITAGTRARITSAGEFSNNKGLSQTEVFGAGATVGDQLATAVGYNANVPYAGGTAIGSGSVSSYTAVGIGYLASGGWQGVAIGAWASTATLYGRGNVAIGNSASSQYEASIAIGSLATSTVANQFITGATLAPITTFTIHGNGSTINLGRDGGTVMSWDSNRNVGIGTTAPQSLLDVQGPVGTGAVGAGILTLATKELTIVDGDELGRINFNSPLATPGSDAILAGASIWAEADDTFSATVNSTELVFGTATTSAAIERMRIDSAGNVGIGTATPGSVLDVNGNINTSGIISMSNYVSIGKSNTVGDTGNANGAIGESNTTGGAFSWDVGYGNASGSGWYNVAFGVSNSIVANGNRQVAFGYGNSIALATTSADNLALGINNSISSASVLSNTIVVGKSNTITATGAIAIGTGITNNTATSLMIGPSDAAKMTILSSGNVGIGTTAPQSLLDVQGPVGTGAVGAGILTLATKELTIVDGDELGRINFNSPLATPGSDAILAGASIWAEADDTFSTTVNSTELVFGTATTSAAIERMRIDSAGNVGIGTSTPGSLMDLVTTKYVDTSSIRMHTSDGSWAGSGTTGSLRINPAASSGLGELTFLNNAGVNFSSLNDVGGTFAPLKISGSSIQLLGGNVGIGTTTPTANLQVAQGTAGVGTVSVLIGGTAWTGVGTQ
ncbi:MAG: hypothetical protein Q7S57_01075 [bacterium]|nr:hypothetical protein [bacterium]